MDLAAWQENRTLSAKLVQTGGQKIILPVIYTCSLPCIQCNPLGFGSGLANSGRPRIRK
jgi:hypothetical protein